MIDPMTLKDLHNYREIWEKSGCQALGVRLTAPQAAALRWELHQLYGQDPGPRLTTLYGLEVLQTDAEAFSLED
ncbi:MAG: hypothetical protein HQL51_06085 [Magnetococcales bacterium]|nr:hypothetical protein [Magnetococcales bacterium]